MSTKTQYTPEQVLEMVRPMIDRNQPSNYRLLPREAWYSTGLDAWVVAVDYDREDVSGIDFARRLADIEEQVEEAIKEPRIHVHAAMYRPD